MSEQPIISPMRRDRISTEIAALRHTAKAFADAQCRSVGDLVQVIETQALHIAALEQEIQRLRGAGHA